MAAKGFAAPVYEEIGQTLQATGLNAYLVHVLSAADLNTVATANGAQARIAYYAQRLPGWISVVEVVATYRTCPTKQSASFSNEIVLKRRMPDRHRNDYHYCLDILANRRLFLSGDLVWFGMARSTSTTTVR